MADAELERLRQKQNVLTTLMLFLVFVEIARLLAGWSSWNLTEIGALAVFLTAIAWLLAFVTT